MFNTILEKHGMGSSQAAAAQAPETNSSEGQSQDASLMAADSASERSVAISQIDVVAQLEAKAASNPQKLNWKVFIVDLLKLLDLDSSLSARKELATELGCPEEKIGDSAQMNIWLHKTVLQHLAKNGGNIPKEFSDSRKWLKFRHYETRVRSET